MAKLRSLQRSRLRSISSAKRFASLNESKPGCRRPRATHLNGRRKSPSSCSSRSCVSSLPSPRQPRAPYGKKLWSFGRRISTWMSKHFEGSTLQFRKRRRRRRNKQSLAYPTTRLKTYLDGSPSIIPPCCSIFVNTILSNNGALSLKFLATPRETL